MLSKQTPRTTIWDQRCVVLATVSPMSFGRLRPSCARQRAADIHSRHARPFSSKWCAEAYGSLKIGARTIEGERMANTIDLDGRTAVVTGGAQGFGKAIASRFVASGA